MLKKIFRKTFLLSGILLLSVFVIGKYSWGCDDKDQWGCGNHDKWDCDDHDRWRCDDHDTWSCNKQSESCHPPKIQIVYLDYNDNSIEFTIWGENFDNGAPPVVTLGGRYNLNVDKNNYSDTHILTILPFQNLEGDFIYGDYKLVVSTCHDSPCDCKYCKEHCSKCKDRYCRDYCSKCKDRYCKNQDPKCKCKDRYSLTIPDPAERQGKPRVIKSEIVEVTKSIIVDANTPVYDPQFKIEETASCDTLGTGFTVTGGGFSSSKNLTIRASMPVKDENGWHVVGTLVGETYSGAVLEITVYAVCAIEL
jgi:hypothetical protein